MENKNNNGTPSLSQYFANDPPSFFDELAGSQEKTCKFHTLSKSILLPLRTYILFNILPLATDNNTKQTSMNTQKAPALTNPLQTTMPVNNSNTPTTNSSTTTGGGFQPGNLTSNTFTGGFKPPDYIENPAELEEDLKISDDIRNFWEPPHTEPGVPPLLTMPGIQTANDLVSFCWARFLGKIYLVFVYI